jgi:molybdate transport system substrate-binding protein
LKKVFSLAAILLMSIIILAGTVNCSQQPAPTAEPSITAQPTQAPQPVTLNISVAASVTDAIKEIDGLYVKDRSWVTITPNFASSGTLQKQIENGAPTDVFISAAAAQMDALQKGQLIIDSSRKNLLINKVVLIVPLDSKLGLTSFNDLTSDKVKQLAIGDPKSVPAGTYAQQAFDQLGITDQLKSKYVIGSDVRQVLTYVESGNVDAGVVYMTDTIVSTKVKIVANAPDEINAKIVYPVAVIKTSKNLDEASNFINFLFGSSAKASFEKFGFTVVSK